MKEIELEFKSKCEYIHIKDKEYGLFWGYNLAETIKEAELDIDLKLIAKGNFSEVCKQVYVCILHYRKVAKSLDFVVTEDLPTLQELKVFFECNPTELIKAVEYLTRQINVLYGDNKKKDQQ